MTHLAGRTTGFEPIVAGEVDSLPLTCPANLYVCNRIAPVKSTGIEVGQAMNPAADMNEPLAAPG